MIKSSFLLKLTFIVMLSFIVVACSNNSNSEPSDSGNAIGNNSGELEGEITVATWTVAADALEKTAEKFMEIHPNTKITIERGGHDYQGVTPSLTSGTGAPDVVHVEQRDYQTFLEQFEGQFLDITEQLKNHKDEFAGVAWQAVEKDGKVMGVPWDLGPAAVWYRTDYYEDAGIDPNEIKTWDDFIESGKKLQDKIDGVSMIAFDTVGSDPNPSTWMILMNQLGGRYTDSEGNIDFANEPNIKAMEMVKRFIDEGIVAHAGNWDELMQTISNGDTASIMLPVWLAGAIKEQAPDQKGLWNVMPLPAFEHGGPNQANLGGGVLGITTQSENPNLAWEFIKYSLLTDEGQEVQQEIGLFPSWQPYYENENFGKVDEYYGFALFEVFAAVSTDIPELKFGPYYRSFHNNLQNVYAEVMTGKLTPEEAFKKYEEQSSRTTGLKIAE